MPHQPTAAPNPWDQPIREPVPPSTPASLSLLYRRYMPRFLGGGELLEPEQMQREDPRFQDTDDDVRLPLEAGTFRDTRLPAPSMLESIRGGFDTVRDLGKPGSLDALRQRGTR